MKTGRSHQTETGLVLMAGIGLVSYKPKPYVYAVFAADTQTRVYLFYTCISEEVNFDVVAHW